ncbi:MAG TPA: 2-hydroxychromene-2-carboxylate isomerase [Kofleriaceae bacterium]|nr:2-hydroxychromene-2-carboxylate isomerase [Kofleriaceae bacterium]
MVAMSLELYFDFSCPYAYIAATQIEAVAARHAAPLTWRPMLLGGVFRSIGAGQGPMATMPPAKARHNAQDMHRWAEVYDTPLAIPPGHPRRTVGALRALLSLPEADWPPVIHGFYRAYWIEGADPSAPETIRRVILAAGLSEGAADRAIAAVDDPLIKEQLRARTDEAVARGVFGAPATFVSGGELAEPLLFWGQDRLTMIEAVLEGWRPGVGPAPAADHPAPAGDARVVEIWYDLSSPFAYLGSTQIEAVCARYGATLRWRPMLLGAMFRDIGTPDAPILSMPENKRTYYARELGYWSSYWGVPFRFSSRFPMRTVMPLRLLLQAGDRIGALTHALYRALWVDDLDISDEGVLATILEREGFDAPPMLEGTRDPAIKQQLIANGTEALRKGVFGAPTFIVDPDTQPLLFWGQDRLQLVERVLGGWQPRV